MTTLIHRMGYDSVYMFPPSPDQLDAMRKSEIESLMKAVEVQSESVKITARKIAAMKDRMLAESRLSDARADVDRRAGYIERAEAWLQYGAADNALLACEIEQAELHHQIEKQNLEAIQDRLHFLQDPPQVFGAVMRPRRPGIVHN